MYAIIKSGGKQYRIAEGDTIKVEKLDAKQGATVKIKDILMIADGDKITIGTPLVKNVTVSAKVTAHSKGPKIRIIKFKRRKNYHRENGHRQAYTELAITGIKSKGN